MRGLVVSLVVHAGFIAAGVIYLPRAAQLLETTPYVPIELVTLAETTNVTAAAPEPEPEPEEEIIEEPVEEEPTLDDAIADAEAAGRSPGDDALELRAELSTQLAAADARRRDVLRRHHAGFHSVWGRVMKTGTQTSFYAHQLERFACLYTSHVANLLLMSSRASFVAPADALPHELTRARRRSASSSPVAADTAARALQSSDDHGAETTGMMD